MLLCLLISNHFLSAVLSAVMAHNCDDCGRKFKSHKELCGHKCGHDYIHCNGWFVRLSSATTSVTVPASRCLKVRAEQKAAQRKETPPSPVVAQPYGRV